VYPQYFPPAANHTKGRVVEFHQKNFPISEKPTGEKGLILGFFNFSGRV
jgi:hypothetical protein